jgi:hypothetical protein
MVGLLRVGKGVFVGVVDWVVMAGWDGGQVHPTISYGFSSSQGSRLQCMKYIPHGSMSRLT